MNSCVLLLVIPTEFLSALGTFMRTIRIICLKLSNCSNNVVSWSSCWVHRYIQIAKIQQVIYLLIYYFSGCMLYSSKMLEKNTQTK